MFLIRIFDNHNHWTLVQVENGGLSLALIEKIFLSHEVYEIIKLSPPKPWDNVSYLTDLYVKKTIYLDEFLES